MEKLVYVLWKRPDLSGPDFKGKLLGEAASRLLDGGGTRLSINVADEHVAHTEDVRLTRFDPPIAGIVSFWVDVAEDRGPLEEVLAATAERMAGYLVLESVPLHNITHVAPLGERTPGINVIACIEKPARMTHDAWLEHWFGHHRKVAVETQCTYAYVRNEVVRPVTADAPPWAAIVEEGFPTEAVTDPMVWYCADGSKEKLEENFARMMESVQAFLEVDRVESNPMSEYRISA